MSFKRFTTQSFFSFLICITGFNVSQAQTINITNGEWAPYLSEDLPHKGIASQIVSEAFKKEDFDVKYGFFPWVRAYEEAKKGNEWQASVIWSKNAERQESFYYSDPIIILRNVFFYLRESEFEWEKVSDLRDYKIGLTRGYSYNKALVKAEESGWLDVERVTSDELNFRKLLRGRISALIANEDVGTEIIKKYYKGFECHAFVSHPRPTSQKEYSVIISKKAPNAKKLLDALNSGLRKLSAEGRIQEILQ
jgi:polar amino acid transport system substrate-binding protein